MSNAPSNRMVTVRNPQGLHLRPADMLVRLATQFESTLRISKDGQWVDCNSILSLLTLGATQGTQLEVSGEGSDAETALAAICALFEAGFHEMNEIEDTANPVVDR